MLAWAAATAAGDEAASSAVADGIGAHLPGQIDLERRIDRHDLGILPDERCVVGPVAGVKLDCGIIVHKIEQPPGAVDEAGDD